MTKPGVFFEGSDSANGAGLWHSDGTVAGTLEVGGVEDVGVSGAAATGLAPSDIFSLGSKILFEGSDSLGDLGLWISDGTAAGTVEIGGAGDAGVSGAASGGLAPTIVATFGSKGLLLGTDSSGAQGLWVTDGTTAGTIELGGLKNAGIVGASSTAFDPANFASFGTEALFSATDSSGHAGLWITDGTTAGTVEIGGLGNGGVTGGPNASTGVAPTEFVTLGDKAFFVWGDPSTTGSTYLWETDGTSAGTTEIGGLGNAGVTGQPSVVSNLVVLDGKMLFTALDSSGQWGVWTSDGSAAGTQEIGGLGSIGVNGISYIGLAASDLTVIGDKVVFEAGDSQGLGRDLWVTDGTAGGTLEIGGPGNQGVNGILSGYFSVSDLTSIGNKAVFEAYDSGYNQTLWVTDGTLGGTFEIGGVGNAGVAGAPSDTTSFDGQSFTTGGLATSDLTSAGDVAYFDATDASGGMGLWVTDGTAAGTHELASGIGASNAIHFTPGSGSSPDDFTGNGASDILLQNGGGTVVDWIVNDGAIVGGNNLGTNPGWNPVGTGNFSGDGTSGILMQNAAGTIVDWRMQNGAVSNAAVLGNSVGFNIVGAGDFTGNGTDDIVLQNSAGTIVDWIVNNGAITAGNDLGTNPGWNVVGTGDFNGDGTSDVLLENSAGTVVDWTMNNGIVASAAVIGNASGYDIVGTGDFTGNGTTDILLQNAAGDLVDWIMSNGAITAAHDLGVNPGWTVAATGDYTGNGVSDVLLTNSAGNVVDWTIQNGVVSNGVLIGNSAGFSVKH